MVLVAVRASVLVVLLGAPRPGHAEGPPVIVPGAESDELSTAVFRRRAPVELHWNLLNLPEHALRLAFAPVGILVGAVERTRVDKPFTGEPKPVKGVKLKFSPRVQAAPADGLGLGAGVAVGGAALPVTLYGGAVARLDGDWQADAGLARTLGELDGRVLRLGLWMEHDADERYYGIGGGSDHDARRALRSDEQTAAMQLDLHPADFYDLSGLAAVGLTRQVLAPGDGDEGVGPPVEALLPGAPAAPPGFDGAVYYAQVNIVGRKDTRDTYGRPSHGSVIELGATLRSDVQGLDLGATTLRAQGTWYLQVLPEARTIVLTAGGAAAIPLYPGATIPLGAMPVLGRDSQLRGYDRTRFRDRYAAWASVEYRWPIYEYLTSQAGLDAFVFTDGATAFGDDSLAQDQLRYSAGGGLRFAHETASIAELTIAGSPEGAQVVFVTTFQR